jgi:cobyrinic acid a,c-diamide synthase
MTTPGLIIAGPRSGAGKTTAALGLMRAFRQAGVSVQPFKNGPDYIDPDFHEAATGRQSFNLDSWAMPEHLLQNLINEAGAANIAICEGSMGLFDGAGTKGASGIGATADIAALTGWPVVLVLDVSGQAQSAAATALGSVQLRDDITIAGVILNKVASDRHEQLVRIAMDAARVAVLGVIRRDKELSLPERHLGLVQAGEIESLDAHLDKLALSVSTGVDIVAIQKIAGGGIADATTPDSQTPPAGRIAMARDDAFSFAYPHLVAGWRRDGAKVIPFSPLADEVPPDDCDLCWLPGGYPELHAGRLSAAKNFQDGLKRFAETKPVHGECGGFMVLGEALIDADGVRHQMTGLLGHTTSFAKRKLNLGYRAASLLADSPLGPKGTVIRGHEFHYATMTDAGDDQPLADLTDADKNSLGPAGAVRAHVSGTFFHMIAPAT